MIDSSFVPARSFFVDKECLRLLGGRKLKKTKNSTQLQMNSKYEEVKSKARVEEVKESSCVVK